MRLTTLWRVTTCDWAARQLLAPLPYTPLPSFVSLPPSPPSPPAGTWRRSNSRLARRREAARPTLTACSPRSWAEGGLARSRPWLGLIWEVRPKPLSGVRIALWEWVKQRVFSLAIVFSVAFLLLVSLVISAALAAAATYRRVLDATTLLRGRRARPRAVTMPPSAPSPRTSRTGMPFARCPRWSHPDEEKLRAHRRGDHKVQGEAQHGGTH